MKNATIELKGDWNEIKGKLKREFAELADDSGLNVINRKEELLGRLQLKLGKTRHEILKHISED